jgi:hypothetical protein
MAADNPGYMVTDGSMRNETMYEGGGKTGMSMIGMPQYRKGGKLMYGHGGKTHKSKYMGGGMTKAMKKYEEGGKTLKSVDSSKNPGLAKLPKEVRNKMGYMKEGGKTFVEKIKQKRADRKDNREYRKGYRKARKEEKKEIKALKKENPTRLSSEERKNIKKLSRDYYGVMSLKKKRKLKKWSKEDKRWEQKGKLAALKRKQDYKKRTSEYNVTPKEYKKNKKGAK